MPHQSWSERTLAFVRENEAMLEGILFLLGFAESLVLLSFFVPASVLFLAIAGLHAAAGGAFLPILLAGMAGAFAGDIASYIIGSRCKNSLPRMWPLRSNPHWLLSARAFIDRYGTVGIIAAKFVGPLRPMVPATCGLLSMPWLSFLAASAISSLVWSFAFLAPSYYGLQWLKP